MPLSSINTRWDCDTFRLSNSCLSPLCTRVPYFLDSFYTNKIAIRLFVVCYPTVTRADRVFNEKKGTPHPPQAVPLPRWGRLFVTQNRFFISPTNPNLKFQPFKQKLTSTTLTTSQTWGRGDRVSAAPIACEGGGDLTSFGAVRATFRPVFPCPKSFGRSPEGTFCKSSLWRVPRIPARPTCPLASSAVTF